MASPPFLGITITWPPTKFSSTSRSVARLPSTTKILTLGNVASGSFAAASAGAPARPAAAAGGAAGWRRASASAWRRPWLRRSSAPESASGLAPAVGPVARRCRRSRGRRPAQVSAPPDRRRPSGPAPVRRGVDAGLRDLVGGGALRSRRGLQLQQHPGADAPGKTTRPASPRIRDGLLTWRRRPRRRRRRRPATGRGSARRSSAVAARVRRQHRGIARGRQSRRDWCPARSSSDAAGRHLVRRPSWLGNGVRRHRARKRAARHRARRRHHRIAAGTYIDDKRQAGQAARERFVELGGGLESICPAPSRGARVTTSSTQAGRS